MESRPNAPPLPEFLVSRLVVLLFIVGLFVVSFYLGHTLRLPFGFWRSTATTCEPPPPPPPLPARAVAAQPEPFIVVEHMPAMIGGLAAMQRRLHYPERARQDGVEGYVIVQIVVDEHGRVVDPVVLRGIGAGCDEAALHAVSASRFRPGLHHGRPARVKMTLPIKFELPPQG